MERRSNALWLVLHTVALDMGIEILTTSEHNFFEDSITKDPSTFCTAVVESYHMWAFPNQNYILGAHNLRCICKESDTMLQRLFDTNSLPSWHQRYRFTLKFHQVVTNTRCHAAIIVVLFLTQASSCVDNAIHINQIRQVDRRYRHEWTFAVETDSWLELSPWLANLGNLFSLKLELLRHTNWPEGMNALSKLTRLTVGSSDDSLCTSLALSLPSVAIKTFTLSNWRASWGSTLDGLWFKRKQTTPSRSTTNES